MCRKIESSADEQVVFHLLRVAQVGTAAKESGVEVPSEHIEANFARGHEVWQAHRGL